MNSEERAIYAVALACLASMSDEELAALRASKANHIADVGIMV
jgi:hypothetical protein